MQRLAAFYKRTNRNNRLHLKSGRSGGCSQYVVFSFYFMNKIPMS